MHHMPGMTRDAQPWRSHIAVKGFIALILAFAVSMVGLTIPANAADTSAVDIQKSLDETQEGNNTSDVFKVGGLVRYRLNISCLTLRIDCGIGTLTDVLDPNLEFVEVINPTTDLPVSSSYDAATRTATMTVGDSTTPFSGGIPLQFTLVARVKSAPADTNGDGYGDIPNQASARPTDGPVATSDIVTIRVPAPTPDWSIDKAASDGKVIPGGTEVYTITWKVPALAGNVDVQSVTLVDTYPAGAEVVNANGGTVDTANHTITWTLGATELSSLSCYGTGTNCYKQIKSIELRFPDPPFKAGDVVTNHASAAVVYANGDTETLADSANTTVYEPVDGLTFRKTGPSKATVGERITWGLSATNTGTTALPVTWIDQIPAGITNVAIDNAGYYTKEVLAADGVTWNTVTTLPDGPATVRFTRTVPGNSTTTIWLRGTVSDAAAATFKNCATAASGSLTPAESCVTTTLVDPFASLRVAKVHAFVDSGASAIKPGDEFTWGVAYAPTAGLPPETANITDLLPPAFEYVSTTCTVPVVNPGSYNVSEARLRLAMASPACSGQTNVVQPTVTTVDSPATGTTQLVWKDVPVYQAAGAGYLNWVIFKVRVKPGTSVLSYKNSAYVETDDMDTFCETAASTSTEPGDTDGDGQLTRSRVRRQMT